jgi:opacity protein-like surface antigen
MKKWVGGLVSVSALLLSGGAMAQGYVSFAAGQSKFVDTCSGISSCDDTGTALKVVGGYSIAEVFSLELGYLNFGKAKAFAFGANAEASASAVTLGGAFKANFTPDFAVHARLGIASVKTKVTTTSSFFNSSASETKAKAYYGLGLSYAVSREVAVEAGIDASKAELQGAKNDVRAITVGARFSF